MFWIGLKDAVSIEGRSLRCWLLSSIIVDCILVMHLMICTYRNIALKFVEVCMRHGRYDLVIEMTNAALSSRKKRNDDDKKTLHGACRTDSRQKGQTVYSWSQPASFSLPLPSFCPSVAQKRIIKKWVLSRQKKQLNKKKRVCCSAKCLVLFRAERERVPFGEEELRTKKTLLFLSFFFLSFIIIHLDINTLRVPDNFHLRIFQRASSITHITSEGIHYHHHHHHHPSSLTVLVRFNTLGISGNRRETSEN